MARGTVRSTYGQLTNIDTVTSTLDVSFTHPLGVANLPDVELILVPEENYTVTSTDFEVNETNTATAINNAAYVTFHDCFYEYDGSLNCVDSVPGVVGNVVKVVIDWAEQAAFFSGGTRNIDLQGSAQELYNPIDEDCVSTVNIRVDLGIITNISNSNQGNTFPQSGDDDLSPKRVTHDLSSFGNNYTTYRLWGVEDTNPYGTLHSPDGWSVVGFDSSYYPIVLTRWSTSSSTLKEHTLRVKSYVRQFTNDATNDNYDIGVYITGAPITGNSMSDQTPTVRKDADGQFVKLPNPSIHSHTSNWIFDWNNELLDAGMIETLYTAEECDAMAMTVKDVWDHTNDYSPIHYMAAHILGLIPSFGEEGVEMTPSTAPNNLQFNPINETPDAQIQPENYQIILDDGGEQYPYTYADTYWGGRVTVGYEKSDPIYTENSITRPPSNEADRGGVDLSILLDNLYPMQSHRVGYIPTACLDTEGTIIGNTQVPGSWPYANENQGWLWNITAPDDPDVGEFTFSLVDGFSEPMENFNPPTQMSVKMDIDNVWWKALTIDQIFSATPIKFLIEAGAVPSGCVGGECYTSVEQYWDNQGYEVVHCIDPLANNYEATVDPNSDSYIGDSQFNNANFVNDYSVCTYS